MEAARQHTDPYTRRLMRIERKVDALLDAANVTIELEAELMESSGGVTQALEAMGQKVDEAVAADVEGAAELHALRETIEGFTPGQELTAGQINDLATKLGAATDTLSGAEKPSPTALPLYEHEGEAVIDEASYPKANVQTAPTDGSAPQPLYTHASDQPGGVPSGTVAGEWASYTGPTQPVA